VPHSQRREIQAFFFCLNLHYSLSPKEDLHITGLDKSPWRFSSLISSEFLHGFGFYMEIKVHFFVKSFKNFDFSV